MPIYEYQCQACENIVEAWQNLSEKPLKVCPDCSGELKKLISMSSFQLKGGGWYADGYSDTKKNGSSCKASSCKANDTCAKPETSSPCKKAAKSACKVG